MRRLATSKVTTAVLALSLLLLTIQSAAAHTRVEVGPYAIVVGWVTEPPVVGERNAVIVEISEDEVPVTGAESTLDAELRYADRTFRANLNPTDTPGFYTVEIFPTVRGQYEVRLFGTLAGMDIDEVIEPEEVFPAARIQFPEPQPDPRELQQQVDELRQQVQTARTIGFVGGGVGLLGLLIGLFGVLRRR